MGGRHFTLSSSFCLFSLISNQAQMSWVINRSWQLIASVSYLVVCFYFFSFYFCCTIKLYNIFTSLTIWELFVLFGKIRGTSTTSFCCHTTSHILWHILKTWEVEKQVIRSKVQVDPFTGWTKSKSEKEKNNNNLNRKGSKSCLIPEVYQKL